MKITTLIYKKASIGDYVDDFTILNKSYLSNLEKLKEYLNNNGVSCQIEGKSLEVTGYDFGQFYLQIFRSGTDICINKYYDNEIKDEEFSYVKKFPFSTKEDIEKIFEQAKIIFMNEKKGGSYGDEN